MKCIVRISGMFLLISLVTSCAKVGNITGGPKDTTPPKIDTLHSTPNYQTHFRPKNIEIRFDEWIKLNAPHNNIVISPPLTGKYNLVQKGKRVLMEFDSEEPWKPNTTYLIHFGASIVDLHEGNPAQDPVYLFSTGAEIDSLVITGTVRDAISGEGVGDILVMLYDQQRDSMPLTEKPYYFAKTDKKGHFTLQHLKRDTFMLFVLKDENRNYKYDLPKEKIGFLDSVLVTGDSANPLELSIFLPELKRRLLEVKQSGRRVKLVYNATPFGVALHPLLGDTLRYWVEGDTVNVWFPDAVKDSIPYVVAVEGRTPDTLVYRPDTAASAPQGTIRLRRVQPLYDPANRGWVLTFNHVMNPDRTQMLLWRDSVPVADSIWAFVLTTSPVEWQVQYPWSEGHQYRWWGLPGSVLPIGRSTPKDTLKAVLPVLKKEELSRLTIKILHPPKGYPLVLQLMEGEKAIRTACLNTEDTVGMVTWAALTPKAYTLRITEDTNGNCRVDTGDWWTRKQPEKVRLKSLEKLRPNWDAEIVIDRAH